MEVILLFGVVAVVVWIGMGYLMIFEHILHKIGMPVSVLPPGLFLSKPQPGTCPVKVIRLVPPDYAPHGYGEARNYCRSPVVPGSEYCECQQDPRSRAGAW